MLIDWFTVVAQAANFLILVWLMKRYLYKPILDAVDARDARIASALKDAEEKKTEAAKDSDDLRKAKEAFEQGRATLLNTAKTEVQSERSRLLDEARKDADALRAKLAAAVQNERDSLGREVATQVRHEVFAISRSVLTDLAAASVEARICGVFNDRLRTMDDDARSGFATALKGSSEPALVRSAFELPDEQRESIRRTLKDVMGAEIAVDFAVAPVLVCGIDLIVNGRKLAWNIDDYLGSLDKRIDELLAVRVTAKAPIAPVSAAAVEPAPALPPDPKPPVPIPADVAA